MMKPSDQQQAPLALTTQPQSRPQLQQNVASQQQQPAIVATTTALSPINHQISQLQSKVQPNQFQTTTTIATHATQPITLATAPTTTGPTTLVIIPQHSTTTSITSTKTATITSKATSIPTTLTATTANVALTTTAPQTAIQLPSTVATIVPTTTTTSVPVTAHQQPAALASAPLVNRPPQTLPVVPITTTTVASVKQEPNNYVCCLLDNNVRCTRKGGNASFSARIQKIVGTKKMNFAIDPNARHTYICEHHKAIITVAKKSANALARETKTNARNYNATTNNVNTLAPQQHNSFNELNMNQATLQHPINLEMLANQNRLANNHTGLLNSAHLRPGAQLAYGLHQGPHHEYQVGTMNQMIPVNFDNAGGDNLPPSSGGVDVDLQQLQVNTLRRYKRHFRVQTRPGLNKMQLAESLKNHFRTLPIIEKEAITYFVYIVKCSRNKLDLNSKAD